MSESCSQNAIDYKKKLSAVVSRLQEEEEKYKEELVGLKDRLHDAGSRMQKQFDRVRTRLTLLYEEDKTAETLSGKDTSSCTAVTIASSSSVISSAPTDVIHDADQMVKQLIMALADLKRPERLLLTEKLIRELKKMRTEDKKIEKKTKKESEEKPQLLNGEITGSVPQGTELKACDSMLTIQMLNSASTSTALSTTPPVAP